MTPRRAFQIHARKIIQDVRIGHATGKGMFKPNFDRSRKAPYVFLALRVHVGRKMHFSCGEANVLEDAIAVGNFINPHWNSLRSRQRVAAQIAIGSSRRGQRVVAQVVAPTPPSG